MRPVGQGADWRIALFGLLALLVWEASGLDQGVMRYWGNGQGFAWRDAWLAREGLHDGGRMLTWLLAALMFINLRWPLWPGPDGAMRIRAFGGLLLGTAAVAVCKRVSHTSCPWELQAFGGLAQPVPHWLFWVADGGPGHCFPSGHAAGAFAFFGGYFMLRPYHPRLARCGLAGILLLGGLLGGAQVVRGAHYPSHVFWSAWLCWVLALLVSKPGLVSTLTKRMA